MNRSDSTALSSGRTYSRLSAGLRTVYKTHDALSSVPAIAGMALGVSILYAGWTSNIIVFIVWYAPLFMACLVGSHYFGAARSTSTLEGKQQKAGLVYCWITCVVIAFPYSIAWSWHRYQAAQCILPPDAMDVNVNVDPIRWNETPHWSVRYRTGLRVPQLCDFYIRAVSREKNASWLHASSAFGYGGSWRSGECSFNFRSDERSFDIAIGPGEEYLNQVEIRPPGYDWPPPILRSPRRR